MPYAATLGGGSEVRIVDSGGGLLPLHAGVLKVTDQLSLFGIHSEDGLAAFFER
jgi:hypothetical protein